MGEHWLLTGLIQMRFSLMKHKTGYPSNTVHCCIDAYKDPTNIEKWSDCPNCGLKPKIWVYDNGRSTACGCWKNEYEHFRVEAESIMSVYIRNKKSTLEYDVDGLKKNWNYWCKTGGHKFRASNFTDKW